MSWLFGGAFLVLFTLKLLGLVEATWLVVFSPAILWVAFCFVIGGLALTSAAVTLEKARRKL